MSRSASNFAAMPRTKPTIPEGAIPSPEVQRMLGCTRQTLDNYRYGHEKGEYAYAPILGAGDWMTINGRIYFTAAGIQKIRDERTKRGERPRGRPMGSRGKPKKKSKARKGR